MSCEDEAALVAELAQELNEVTTECDGIEFNDDGSNSSELSSCRTYEGIVAGNLARAKLDLENCHKGERAMTVRTVDGRLTFLRVNDVRTGYGGGETNRIDAEVILKLDTEPYMGFGFQLRHDEFFPSRQGMLSLLRDAYHRDLELRIDYLQRVKSPQRNVIAHRVALIKPPPSDRRAPDIGPLELS